MTELKSIGVVGGGIIGLATAEAILEDIPNVSITVYASEYSPNTTADISAGFIYPFLIGEQESEQNLVTWTNRTVEHLLKTAEEDEEFAKSMSPISGYILWKNGPVRVPYLVEKASMGARLVKQEEIWKITKNQYAGGVFCTSWSCDSRVYLRFLMNKLKSRGVKFITETVTSLENVAEKGHDIVANCTGFGARSLAEDYSVAPLRGQVITARAPWIQHFFVEGDGDSYIIPRVGTIVIGGTHTNDSSLDIDQEVSEKLWSEACNLLPSLQWAEKIGDHVGIRPFRPSIRIEAEIAKTTQGRKYVRLHHYGHSGSGLTVHWGCAKRASAVLAKFLLKNESKL